MREAGYPLEAIEMRGTGSGSCKTSNAAPVTPAPPEKLLCWASQRCGLATGALDPLPHRRIGPFKLLNKHFLKPCCYLPPYGTRDIFLSMLTRTATPKVQLERSGCACGAWRRPQALPWKWGAVGLATFLDCSEDRNSKTQPSTSKSDSCFIALE